MRPELKEITVKPCLCMTGHFRTDCPYTTEEEILLKAVDKSVPEEKRVLELE